MPRVTVNRIISLCALLALTVGFVGCGESDSSSALLKEANGTNIKRLANLYNKYLAEHGWKGPKDEAEFKSFISKIDPSVMKDFNADASKVDGMFTSERDSKAFVIRWEVQGGMGASDPVIFEDTGMDGQRQVAFTGMKLEEVGDARYKDFMAGKGGAKMNLGGETAPKQELSIQGDKKRRTR